MGVDNNISLQANLPGLSVLLKGLCGYDHIIRIGKLFIHLLILPSLLNSVLLFRWQTYQI